MEMDQLRFLLLFFSVQGHVYRAIRGAWSPAALEDESAE
jgi:hypothetical protein